MLTTVNCLFSKYEGFKKTRENYFNVEHKIIKNKASLGLFYQTTQKFRTIQDNLSNTLGRSNRKFLPREAPPFQTHNLLSEIKNSRSNKIPHDAQSTLSYNLQSLIQAWIQKIFKGVQEKKGGVEVNIFEKLMYVYTHKIQTSI